MENKRQGLTWPAYKTVSEKLGNEVGDSHIKLDYDIDIKSHGVDVEAMTETENCGCVDTMAAIVYILENLGFFRKGNEHWELTLKILIDATREAYKFGFDQKGAKQCVTKGKS